MSDVNYILYVGIDVSKGSNQVFGMNFDQKKLLSFNSPNNNDGASIIEEKIIDCLTKNSLKEVLLEFRTPEDIVNTPIENLVEFLDSKSKSRFTDPKTTALLLQKCARSSYRLDKSAYDPINTAI